MGRAQDVAPADHVAFLMTDIEGSTRLWENDPAAMQAALARHDEILEDQVTKGGGRLLTHRGEGDSAFSVFTEPAGAVACAVGIQQAFTEEPWPTEGPLRVRIGLHVGNALGRDAEFVQPAVNRCARLRDLASGGQILASGDCVRAAASDAPGVTFEHVGDHSFRGLDAPIAVYQVCHPAIEREFPTIGHRRVRATHNIPAETTSFVGRKQDLDHLDGILTEARSRLVTLTGPGGVGKTRLAQRVAYGAQHLFSDGVWLVDLTALTEPRLLANLVASSLRVPEEVGRRVADTLDDFLATRRLLLVLDNCEHLVEACAEFAARLLKTAPRVTILATSREALRVVGERALLVEPLELNDPTGAGPGEAVRLFIDRAALAGVTIEPSPDVNEICEHLDGLPLAIELAASWAQTMSPAEIAAGLSHRFRLLESPVRGGPEKLSTLRGSVDWSYGLLGESERALFRRLSVFAGTFTVDAARQVYLKLPTTDDDTMPSLASLVRKSLVVVAERSSLSTRYRLLETLRVYAADRLAESGEEEEIRDRLAAYVDAICQLAERRLNVADREWSNRIDEESHNVRSALDWTRDRDPERFIRMCDALITHWANTARYSEGRMWLTHAVEIQDATPAAAGRALWGLGFLTALQFDFPGAVGPFQRALEIFRSIGDERGIARCVCWLGLILAFAMGKKAAHPLIDEGLDLARAKQDRFALITGLYAKGLVLGVYHNAPSARPVFIEAIDHARGMGDPVSVAAMTIFLGMAELFAGEYRRAHSVLQEGVALAAAARAPLWLSAALTFLGGVLDQMGRYDDASAAFDESTSITARIAHIQMSRNLHWRSRVALHRGDLKEATTLIDQELNLPTAGQFLYGSLMRVQRAEVQVAMGDAEAARRDLAKTITRLRETDARWALARTLLMSSRAEAMLGDSVASAGALREAVGFAGAFGDRATITDILEWAAEVSDDAAAAARLLGAAGRIRSETGYAPYEVDRPALAGVQARVEAALGFEAFKLERAAGESLSDSDALALANIVAT